MRLESLYIKGFKSFANETVLHFKDDVIGVVGPNGSGKSNIVDAIRWVLGEQKSKELRLESMSDVIFNGTKTRKEAPTATVELVFENDKNIIGTEYSTVAISRTLYRSGESEYRINNVICRLKDITSLFMDTGIGSNSYAIIALGMVDDILADKDNARRRMFEQAAGISKYKKRKRETLQKLQSNAADLDRINDLLFEIEGNMKSLEKQARRTKKYFAIKEEYKTIAVNLASRSIQALKEEYKALENKISVEQVTYSSLQTQLSQKEAEVAKEKKKHLDKEVFLSEKQKELNHLVSDIRNLENEKDLLQQRIEFKLTNIKSTKSSIEKNKSLLTSSEADIIDLQKSLEVENAKVVLLKEDLEVLEKQYQKIKSQQNEAKILNDARIDRTRTLQQNLFEIDKNVALISSKIESNESELIRLKGQDEDNAEILKRIKADSKDIEQKITSKQKEQEAAKAEENERINKINALEQQRDLLQEEINKINRILDSKQNEYDLLKSMVESYEGFPESIKYLSTKWRKDVPVLSDLLDVSDEYKSIIEQYLESYLNYYVVESIVQAKEAIRLLSGAQKGKANFFLLEELPNATPPNISLPRCTPAIDMVKVDLTYQGLLNYLLKDVFIFDGEMEDFIINKEHSDKIFLSKHGSFIKAQYAVSGGSIGLFEGKRIGRKKNLEKIQKLILKNETAKESTFKKLDHVKNELQTVKAANLKVDIERTTNQLNALISEQNKINFQEETIKKAFADRTKKFETLDQDNIGKKKELESLDLQKQQVEADLQKLELDFKKEGGSLDVLNEELRNASENYNNANINVIKQESLAETIRKDLNYKTSRIDEIKKRIVEEDQKLNDDQKDLLDSREKLTLNDKKLEKLYVQKKGHQGNLSQAEQDYYEARNAISKIEEEVKNINRNLNQKQVEINNIKDQFNDVRFKISGVGERLKIEFDISINEIINEPYEETLPLDELTERVEKLKNRLANYGEINPMALQAYEEIKERYDNIVVQRADILDAKESLLTTIKEIETTATAKFMDAFTTVREHFIMVFRSLFTEDDNCDLILIDEHNPLDSDIEIIAKPKGKKPKSLSQLSGGEKTLTATALLFALYLLKPAPFCIFDEVDAPLDDANIQKFNKIIKKFSKESQFIIVTHNKATMAAVDVLYGVYMQEVGISQVTPVDFRSLKEQPIYEQLN